MLRITIQLNQDKNYTDATPANKQAYDNAVNTAKGVMEKRIIQQWMLIQ